MGRTRKPELDRLGRMSEDGYRIFCAKHKMQASALGRLSEREYKELDELGRISSGDYKKYMEMTEGDRLTRGGIRKLRSKR